MSPIHSAPATESKSELLFNPDEVKNVDENNIANFSGINSENIAKLNETTSAEPGKKPEKFNIRNRAIKIGVAALAVIVGVSIGIASLNRKPKPTETEITETTNSETQETEISWWELDWSKQSPELQRLNNLSVEEFRNESLENQLLYYSFVNDVYYNYFFTSNGVDNSSYYTDNKTASLDDTAQKIVDQEKNKMVMAAYASDENGYFDKDEARKLLSATVYDIISNTDATSASNEADAIIKYDKAFAGVPDGEIMPNLIDHDSLTQVGKNRSEITYDNEGIPCVSLTMTQPGTYDVYLEFKFKTFTNFKGEEESIWLNTLAKQVE